MFGAICEYLAATRSASLMVTRQSNRPGPQIPLSRHHPIPELVIRNNQLTPGTRLTLPGIFVLLNFDTDGLPVPRLGFSALTLKLCGDFGAAQRRKTGRCADDTDAETFYQDDFTPVAGNSA
ncbi:hypothetical protein [Marinobacter sp. X15-166B]|uniref:hypothetical protein n=1 Tax=Marinobacter sp. X15-166B TaxID=1897620 RepID=UPI001D17241C|nr:hypothetical protein [Marinobacter sp. X15-166B]